jgi:hypothetical protein
VMTQAQSKILENIKRDDPSPIQNLRKYKM